MSTANFLIAEIKSAANQLLAVMTVAAKDFKTGSRGFYANQKFELDGKRYQVQVQIVEIGSKKSPKTGAEAEEAGDPS